MQAQKQRCPQPEGDHQKQNTGKKYGYAHAGHIRIFLQENSGAVCPDPGS